MSLLELNQKKINPLGATISFEILAVLETFAEGCQEICEPKQNADMSAFSFHSKP